MLHFERAIRSSRARGPEPGPSGPGSRKVGERGNMSNELSEARAQPWSVFFWGFWIPELNLGVASFRLQPDLEKKPVIRSLKKNKKQKQIRSSEGAACNPPIAATEASRWAATSWWRTPCPLRRASAASAGARCTKPRCWRLGRVRRRFSVVDPPTNGENTTPRRGN